MTPVLFFFFPEFTETGGEAARESGLGVAMSYDRFKQLERQQLRRLQMIRRDDEEALAIILALMRRNK